MYRDRDDLLELAGQYATRSRVPIATVVKEILHYEILYALNQSSAIAKLTFQGGTALRLCYQGTRYSEDLDFAGGHDFDPAVMGPFTEVLQREIGEAYGLEVEIKEPRARPAGEDGVAVARWSARVRIPQDERDVVQKQVINIEVASVPAYEQDLVAIGVNYAHLPQIFSQMLVRAETLNEILADKVVALGARGHFKARDIWDIKFLLDRNVNVDSALVGKKLVDYGWTEDAFKAKLDARIALLAAPETAKNFRAEMSRFVDGNVSNQLSADGISERYLNRAAELGRQVLSTPLIVPRPRTPQP